MLRKAKLVGRCCGRPAEEVGPRVLGAGPTLPSWMKPRAQLCRHHSSASNSHLPGQMQLRLLAAGQGEQW